MLELPTLTSLSYSGTLLLACCILEARSPTRTTHTHTTHTHTHTQHQSTSSLGSFYSSLHKELESPTLSHFLSLSYSGILLRSQSTQSLHAAFWRPGSPHAQQTHTHTHTHNTKTHQVWARFYSSFHKEPESSTLFLSLLLWDSLEVAVDPELACSVLEAWRPHGCAPVSTKHSCKILKRPRGREKAKLAHLQMKAGGCVVVEVSEYV